MSARWDDDPEFRKKLLEEHRASLRADRLERYRNLPAIEGIHEGDPELVVPKFEIGDYQTYLNGPIWRGRRDQALERAFHRCQVCNAGSDLHVHHRTYERIGNEDPSDLTVLCAPCHKLFHDHGRLR